MELISENLSTSHQAANRLEALRTLTKLLLYEIESLAQFPALNGGQTEERTTNLNDNVQRYEVTLICKALLESGGNQRQAAKILGMKTTTLHAKIRRYEIDALSLYGQFANDDPGAHRSKNGEVYQKRDVAI